MVRISGLAALGLTIIGFGCLGFGGNTLRDRELANISGGIACIDVDCDDSIYWLRPAPGGGSLHAFGSPTAPKSQAFAGWAIADRGEYDETVLIIDVWDADGDASCTGYSTPALVKAYGDRTDYLSSTYWTVCLYGC